MSTSNTIIYETIHQAHAPSDLDKLKNLFPQCFDKEGNLLMAKLLDLLGKNSDEGITEEWYSLNWLGKAYAKLLRDMPTQTLISPDEAHNSKEENKNSQNLYIEGDNLDVLKHLKNAYRAKVKMIYIDPPYNTGSDDFVYKDNFNFTEQELSAQTGISLEEAKRTLSFMRKGSNSHSAWLTFMYPRLYIARELLKDDGVIFISIDENEQAQLKLLCDQMFGEENFVTEFVWKSRSSMQYSETLVSSQTESILLYAKNKSVLSQEGFNKVKKDTDKMSYANPDNDPNGEWTSSGIVRDDGRKKYKLTSPSGKTFTKPWLYTEENMQKLIDQGVIYWGVNGDAEPRKKNYWNDYDGKPSSNLLQDEYVFYTNEKDEIKKKKSFEIGITQSGTAEVKKHFGIKMFDYPKPVSLIQYLIFLVKFNDNDIVMDFFSGSGTSAEAVLNINAHDGIERKFILVQLPETINEKQTDLIDFCVNELKQEPIIPTIAKERIKRAAKKIKEENKDKEYINDIDFGFKVFKTTEALQDSHHKQGSLFAQKNEEETTLLYTYLLHDGFTLTQPIKTLDLDGYNAYIVQSYIYLLSPQFEEKHCKALIRFIHQQEDGKYQYLIMNNCLNSVYQLSLANSLTSSHINVISRTLGVNA